MANPELKWWHVRWKKLALRLAIAFAVIYLAEGAVEVVGSQLRPWWYARHMFAEIPVSRLELTPLPDPSLAQLSGTRIEAFGYSIQTPWNEQPKIKDYRTMTSVAFMQSNAGLLIFDPASDDGLRIVLNMKSDPDMESILGKQALNSRYDLMAAEIDAMPEQAKWWKMPRENARVMMLVAYKSMEFGSYETVHKIEAGGLRGFQEGDPTKSPYHVRLDLFNPADQRFLIQISAGHNQGPVLTQAQLNAMVASIQPVEKK
jgi:hypothetical protein